MRLNNKLSQWQQAGLIDKHTVQNITEYEKSSSKPVVLWAAGGLGAFAIIVGIVSVVAANWLYMPDEVKLGIDLILCVLLAFAVFKTCLSAEATQEKLWLREILVIVYYGFTLASMALIGQIYQLGGSMAKLLLVWTIATVPLVLLARGKFVATIWVVGTAITYGLNIDAFNDFARYRLDLNRDTLETIIISLTLIGPLLFIYLSRVRWLLQHRPVYAEEISRYSWLVIVAAGFFAQFLWYERTTANDISTTVFVVSGVATALTAALIPALYKDTHRNTHLAMRVVLLTVFILGFAACWHSTSMNLVGALTNLAYLCILAWAALKIGSTPLFNVLTAVISIRILFIYFEVFGSMLQTGLGLIVGGILTLLLAWLWFKKSSNLAEKLTNAEQGSGGLHDE